MFGYYFHDTLLLQKNKLLSTNTMLHAQPLIEYSGVIQDGSVTRLLLADWFSLAWAFGGIFKHAACLCAITQARWHRQAIAILKTHTLKVSWAEFSVAVEEDDGKKLCLHRQRGKARWTRKLLLMRGPACTLHSPEFWTTKTPV